MPEELKEFWANYVRPYNIFPFTCTAIFTPGIPFSKDIFRKMDLREKRLKKIDRRRLFVYNIR